MGLHDVILGIEHIASIGDHAFPAAVELQLQQCQIKS
jgi:hypothetical protein